MPAATHWSTEEDELLRDLFSRMPGPFAVAQFVKRAKENGWPDRRPSAVQTRANRSRLNSIPKHDWLTMTELSKGLSLPRHRIKAWYYRSPYEIPLQVTRVGRCVYTRRSWVRKFLWPGRAEANNFQALNDVDDEVTLEWLFEGDEELEAAFWDYRERGDRLEPDAPICLQRVADHLGISRFRVWCWAYRANPPLPIWIEGSDATRRLYTTLKDVRAFLGQPTCREAVQASDRLHLIRDAKISGIHWLYDGVHAGEELTRFTEYVINHPPARTKRAIVKKCLSGRILCRYPSITAAAKANYCSRETFRTRHLGKPPQPGQTYRFEYAAIPHRSIESRLLVERTASRPAQG